MFSVTLMLSDSAPNVAQPIPVHHVPHFAEELVIPFGRLYGRLVDNLSSEFWVFLKDLLQLVLDGFSRPPTQST